MTRHRLIRTHFIKITLSGDQSGNHPGFVKTAWKFIYIFFCQEIYHMKFYTVIPAVNTHIYMNIHPCGGLRIHQKLSICPWYKKNYNSHNVIINIFGWVLYCG
jgi:hypothetical protein